MSKRHLMNTTTATAYVVYFRVSTKAQGRSGLGLDAQRSAVDIFLSTGGRRALCEFTDVDHGDDDQRPQFLAALQRCKLTGATLLIAKLDRMARDLHVLTTLERAGIEFVACDNPFATRLTLHILMAVAQDELDRIRTRTREALAEAKARGVKLGGYRGGPVVDGKLGGQAVAKAADEFADLVGPIILEMRQAGLTLQQIADKLAEQGIQTRRGGRWAPMQVKNLLDRLK